MGLFFGTDGIRGRVNDDLTHRLACRCGNALAKNGNKILIGADTRHTGSFITQAFVVGALAGGADVLDVGICPTAGIGYLVKNLGYDFGVVISASHNPPEYNGIKIFNKNGRKLSESKETEIEKQMISEKISSPENVGVYKFSTEPVKNYESFLRDSISSSLRDKTIVLDCSNGAASKIAPKVFRENGARVIETHCKPNGFNINQNCGSLNIQGLQKDVLENVADMGFAFDGDSDRVIAVDEKGNVVDGDSIIYLFAMHYKQNKKLVPPVVVGTILTNMGTEKALQKEGVSLVRTAVGDKFISEVLEKQDLLVGGEQAGHVFVKDKHSTGDGILNALLIAEICAKNNKKLSEFFTYKQFQQCSINVQTKNKELLATNTKLKEKVEAEQEKIGINGRIIIRPSGTEPYIRIFVETEDKELSTMVANEIAEFVRQID